MPLSLPESVALGLRDNRSVRIAYADRVAQKFDLRVAEDKFNPKLTISSSFLAQGINGTTGTRATITPIATLQVPTGAVVAFSWANVDDTVRGGDRDRSSTANLTVIQPLLRGGGRDANLASVRIARLDERINQLRLRSIVNETVSRIILGYRELVRAQEQLRLEESALERARSLISVNRALIEAGRMAEVEIVQAEANAALQEFAAVEAANRRDAARLDLLNLLALDQRTDLVAIDEPGAAHTTVDLDRVLPIALDHRTDYRSQALAVERSRIDLDTAKNQRLWDLAAVGSVGTGFEDASGRTLRTESRTVQNASAGLQLTIPIGDLTFEQAEVRAATTLRRAEIQLDATRQQVELEVRDAVRNIEARWRQLEIARHARSLAVRTLEIEKEKLQVGRSSNFQVLSFENDLRRSDNQQLDALIQYLNALTILDQQLGTTVDTWQIALNA